MGDLSRSHHLLRFWGPRLPATYGAFVTLLETSMFSYFSLKFTLESWTHIICLCLTLHPPAPHRAVQGKSMTEDKFLPKGPQEEWFGEGLEEWFW